MAGAKRFGATHRPGRRNGTTQVRIEYLNTRYTCSVLDFLWVGLNGVILAGFAFFGRDAESFFQPFAGLLALGAAVALGLHGSFASRRNGHFNDSGHYRSSIWLSFFCKRASCWKCLVTALQARL